MGKKTIDFPVLVTGATSGMGLSIARYLCQHGVQVFAGYRQPQGKARLVEMLGQRASPICIDIVEPDSVAEAVSRIAKESPEGLSGLVNNAGIAVAGPLECLPIDRLRKEFEVNVVGGVRTTQACLPLIRKAQGRVLHIGSAAGSFALPFVGPYAASKFAVEAIADSMRRELHPLGIPVILIRPGRMVTGIFDRAEADALDMLATLPEEQQARYEPYLKRFQTLMHRSADRRQDPNKVARVVHRALRSRWPRARYNVGLDAYLAAEVGKWVPDWLSDYIIRKVIRVS